MRIRNVSGLKKSDTNYVRDTERHRRIRRFAGCSAPCGESLRHQYISICSQSVTFRWSLHYNNLLRKYCACSTILQERYISFLVLTLTFSAVSDRHHWESSYKQLKTYRFFIPKQSAITPYGEAFIYSEATILKNLRIDYSP